MTTQASKTTCWIPKSHLPALKVKVEALDRKAAKLGMKPFSIEVLEENLCIKPAARLPAGFRRASGGHPAGIRPAFAKSNFQ